MTSRELFVLLEQLPEESATATALRDGDWTTDRHLQVRMVNLLAFFRADWSNAHGASRNPDPILTPLQIRQQEEERAAQLQAQQALHDLVHGRIKIAAATRVTPRGPEVEVT